MKSHVLFTLLLTALITTTACKSTKKATQTTTTTPISTTSTPLSINAILTQMEANASVAQRMSGDGDLDIESEKLNQSATCAIRWRRDSVIWLNIKKLGFNVARAQVTRDSVFMVSYFQSQYAAQPLSYIEKQFGLPADFDLLQNFLLGKPIFLTDKKQLTLNTPKESTVVLRGSNERWTAEYLFDFASQQLTEMTFSEPKAQRTMKISYEKYAALRDGDGKERPFAYLRTIMVESPQTGKVKVGIEIEASSLEVNVLKAIRFEIPSGYKRMD
jgi:outer membrane biogenesis lipoprotein LolB